MANRRRRARRLRRYDENGNRQRPGGLDPLERTARELRHSVVSLLSDADVPIECISRLVGSGSTTTETIYRKQIRPVIVHGADIMDRIPGRTGTPDSRAGPS